MRAMPWAKALVRGELRRILRTRAYTRALERGHFRKIMGDSRPLWRFIERQASIPHTERVALRLPQESGWDLWVSYKIVETNPVRIYFENMYIPADERHAKTTPCELEGVPVFELAIAT